MIERLVEEYVARVKNQHRRVPQKWHETHLCNRCSAHGRNTSGQARLPLAQRMKDGGACCILRWCRSRRRSRTATALSGTALALARGRNGKLIHVDHLI